MATATSSSRLRTSSTSICMDTLCTMSFSVPPANHSDTCAESNQRIRLTHHTSCVYDCSSTGKSIMPRTPTELASLLLIGTFSQEHITHRQEACIAVHTLSLAATERQCDSHINDITLTSNHIMLQMHTSSRSLVAGYSETPMIATMLG